jgi:hypothetical protein
MVTPLLACPNTKIDQVALTYPLSRLLQAGVHQRETVLNLTVGRFVAAKFFAPVNVKSFFFNARLFVSNIYEEPLQSAC